MLYLIIDPENNNFFKTILAVDSQKVQCRGRINNFPKDPGLIDI